MGFLVGNWRKTDPQKTIPRRLCLCLSLCLTVPPSHLIALVKVTHLSKGHPSPTQKQLSNYRDRLDSSQSRIFSLNRIFSPAGLFLKEPFPTRLILQSSTGLFPKQDSTPPKASSFWAVIEKKKKNHLADSRCYCCRVFFVADFLVIPTGFLLFVSSFQQDFFCNGIPPSTGFSHQNFI